MEVDLRRDGYFVEDESWCRAEERYRRFLEKNSQKKVLFLELGVGNEHAGDCMKYPFWQMTGRWKNAFYVCLNQGQAWAPEELKGRSLCVDEDIADVLEKLAKGKISGAGAEEQEVAAL